jgi:hypothetical protein
MLLRSVKLCHQLVVGCSRGSGGTIEWFPSSSMGESARVEYSSQELRTFLQLQRMGRTQTNLDASGMVIRYIKDSVSNHTAPTLSTPT